MKSVFVWLLIVALTGVPASAQTPRFEQGSMLERINRPEGVLTESIRRAQDVPDQIEDDIRSMRAAGADEADMLAYLMVVGGMMLTYWGYWGIGNDDNCPTRDIRSMSKRDYSVCENWAWIGAASTVGGFIILWK